MPCLLYVLSRCWVHKLMNACCAALIYSPFPISSVCLRSSSSNFNLTIKYRQKVGFLPETFTVIFKRPSPQANEMAAPLLSCQELGKRLLSCLLFVCSCDKHAMTWSTGSPFRQAWDGESQQQQQQPQLPGRNPLLLGRGSFLQGLG